MLPPHHIPIRGTTIQKKALLVGIGYNYHKGSGKLDPIPTSIPNVKKMAIFLKGGRSLSFTALAHSHNPLYLLEHCGYTDIIIMTDEDGVPEKLQPTKINLVRPPSSISPQIPHTLTMRSFRGAK